VAETPRLGFDWRWFFLGVGVMLVFVIVNRIIG
jgi:hypothetical protein